MGTPTDEEGDINEILLEVGKPGRYQLNAFVWTFLATLVIAFQTVSINFIEAQVDFR